MSSSVSDGTAQGDVGNAIYKQRTKKNNSKDFVITAAISGVVIAVFAGLIMSSSPQVLQGGGTPTTGVSPTNLGTPPQPVESSGPPTAVSTKLNNTCSKNTINGTWVFFGTDQEHYQYDSRNSFIQVQAYGVIHASQKHTVKINMTGPLDDPNDTIKPKTLQVVDSAGVQDIRNKEFYYLSYNIQVYPNTWQYGSKFMLQAQYGKAWSCQSVFYIDHPGT